MNAYEYTVKISSKGQIVIPCYLRFLLRLAKGDRLKVELINDSIVLTPIRLWGRGKTKVR